MTEVVLKEMLGESHANKELVDRLKFDNDIITKSTVGKVSNSGPRIGVGVGFMTGSFYEFANRPQRLKEAWILVPAVSMIGYQLGGPVRGNR